MQFRIAGLKFAATTVVMSGLLALTGQAVAADFSLPVTGNLLGLVVDGNGNPQMGATVQLLNRYERVLAKAITAGDGRFVFASLPLDTYGVRVSQPSFLPALRERIAIKAGTDSVLQIHLATLFSDIKVSYKLPSGAMTNDWKWVLRTSAATRPVIRYLPAAKQPSGEGIKPRLFSDTHGMVSLSGGDGGEIDTDSARTDLGSGFAISTNLFGKNQLQVAGAYGQNADFGPASMSLAAIYNRTTPSSFGNPPEVTLTVSQFAHFGTEFAGASQVPSLRTMSMSVYNTLDPLDNLHLEYGVTGESVDYLQHSARVSPFARATLSLGSAVDAVAAYSDGSRPDELTAHAPQPVAEADAAPTSDLFNAVNALSRLPQISNREGHLQLQRTQNYELGFGRRANTRTYAVSAFYERVSNGRLNLAGNLAPLDSGDLLFDGVSKTATYNIGSYVRSGYLGSVTQRVSDLVDLDVAYGRLGGFVVGSSHLGNLGGEQQQFLQMAQHDVASASLRAAIPSFGTRINAGYGWVDTGAVVPLHVFITQSATISPGLNFMVKQPIPSIFGLPGHLELTADLRNLLAQGYIPIASSAGGQLLVVQSPRAIRGGLNFTF